jgi:DNA polymerase-3 subunit beta
MSAPTTATRTGFDFSLDPADFAAIAGWVARRIPAKPKDPLLGGLMLTIEDDIHMTLSAFDYDVSTRAHSEVIGHGAGAVLVSGRLMAELVQTFPARRPLSVRYEGNLLQMSCGGWKGSLPTMPLDDYPALPDVPATFGTVSASDFASITERVAVATSKDATKPEQTGVLLTFGPTEIVMSATDKYRAGVARIGWIPVNPNTNVAVLVPASILLDTTRVLGQVDNDATIALDHGLFGLVGSTVNITARTLDAKNYQGIPGDPRKFVSPTPIGVDVDDLTRALKRADLVRGEKAPVTLSADGSTLSVQVFGADDGLAADEDMPCTYAGPQITVGINPTYLLEALGTIHTPTVDLSLTGERAAVALTPPDGAFGYVHVISPIRRPSVPGVPRT